MALTKPKLSQNIDTDISVFSDPILVLHQGSALADVDTGFLFNRANGLVSNVAFYWSESDNSFVTALTSSTGAADANISVSSYANVRSGVVTVNRISTIDGIYWSGNGAAFSSAPGGTTGDIQFNDNQNFGGANIRFDSTTGNLVITSETDSTSNITGALVIYGGAGVKGNVYTQKIYTTEGLFWAGNGNAVVTGASFTNIAVTGGNTITANVSGTSTLTFTAGPGFSISADEETDSITFTTIRVDVWTSDSDFRFVSEAADVFLDNGLITETAASNYDLGSFFVIGLVQGSSILANTIPGDRLITGTDVTLGNVIPAANITYDLGSTTLRWKTLYTGDINLSNGIGDYTIVEGEEDLFLYNNRSGKVFKFLIQEVDPALVPKKTS